MCTGLLSIAFDLLTATFIAGPSHTASFLDWCRCLQAIDSLVIAGSIVLLAGMRILDLERGMTGTRKLKVRKIFGTFTG